MSDVNPAVSDPPADPNPPAGPNPPGDPPASLLPPPADPNAPPTLSEGEWLVTPTQKGTGTKPEFMLDKFKSLDEQAKGYGELEKKFGAFTGAPDEYKLTVPEGVDGEFDAEDPLLKAGIEFAKESNMSQEAFDKMVGMWIKHSVDGEAQGKEVEIQALGANADARLQTVNNFLENNLDADQYKKIEPLMTTAQSIQIVEMLVNATAPKVPPIGGGDNPEGLTKSKLHELRFALYESGPHKGEMKTKYDVAYRAEVDAYAKKLLGED